MSRRLLVLAGLLAVFAACTNEPFDPDSLENMPPVARISVDHGDSLAATSYNEARFAWSGSDQDGFVVGFWVSIETNDDEFAAPWIYTTDDDTVATWTTREDGTIVPVLSVVAVDDRGALSDTARVAFPLVNSPPVLEYGEDFEPPAASLGAADFDLFTFDVDGDDTLEDFVEYRYAGSDPDVVFAADDSTADPALGWVKADRPRRGFRLRLRSIPPGDPDDGDRQTVYMRVRDVAGAATVLEHTWVVPPIRGSVLVVDDDSRDTLSRDAFFEAAVQAHFGDQWTRVAAAGLAGDPEVVQASLEAFDTILWYVQRQGKGANIEAVHEALETFLTSDRDPDTAGVQPGKLYLDFQYVGAPSGTSQLNDAFRTGFLKVQANPFEGQITSPEFVQGEIGPELDILSGDAAVGDLIYTGNGEATYFDLWPIGVPADAATLYRFESARWSARCRTGCEPPVASRFPAAGEANVVCVSFQLELTDDLAVAQQTLRSIWSDVLGIEALTIPGGAQR